MFFLGDAILHITYPSDTTRRGWADSMNALVRDFTNPNRLIGLRPGRLWSIRDIMERFRTNMLIHVASTAASWHAHQKNNHQVFDEKFGKAQAKAMDGFITSLSPLGFSASRATLAKMREKFLTPEAKHSDLPMNCAGVWKMKPSLSSSSHSLLERLSFTKIQLAVGSRQSNDLISRPMSKRHRDVSRSPAIAVPFFTAFKS